MQSSVYQILRERILGLAYPPGTVLKATEIATELGVSPTPVREAFIRLQMDGLIDRTRNSSPTVTAPLFRTIREALVVRHHLTPLVGTAAVQHIREDEITALESIVEEATRTQELTELMRLDTRFHQILDGATRNEVLLWVLERLRLQMQRLWLLETDGGRYEAMRIEDYRQCITALKEKDSAQLVRVLRRHQRRFVEELNASILEGTPLGNDS